MNGFGDTSQSDTTPSDTTQPNTGQPNTGQPNTGQPDTGQPDTGQSNATQSEAAWTPPPAGRPGRPPLRRAYHGRMLAGVCAGIADYLAVDVTIVRVAFAVFTFLGGAGIPAYLACLLLIPEEGSDQSIAASLIDGFR